MNVNARASSIPQFPLPPVTVNANVVQGNAAKVLTDLSGSDDLLVVGSRGLGGSSGLLLGR